ncbi:MAG: nitric-oxide reductase large subunit [Halanaeroarchaeum sp.]
MQVQRQTIAKLLAAVFVVNLVVMGAGAWATYQSVPELPSKVVGPDGQTIATEASIQDGKTVFQRNGLMDYGSVLGEGSYFGADFTAKALRLKATYMHQYYARERFDTAYADLTAEQAAQVDAMTERDLRERGERDPAVIHYSAAEAYAHEQVREDFVSAYHDGEDHPALVEGTIASAGAAREFADFALWTAWISSTERPGSELSYTNNWPPVPASGNELPSSALLWTVFAFLILVGGVGAIVWLFYFIELPKPTVPDVGIPDPTEVTILPEQVATAKFVALGGALFLVQTMLGGFLAHYYIERGGFYGLGDLIGVNIVAAVPFQIARSWHVELAIIWVAVLWIGGGILFAHLLTNERPRGQRTLVNVLFGALAVVGVGSLAGIWLGVQGYFDGQLWWILGSEGLEYLEMGRLWQVGVLVGFALWLAIMYRGLRPLLDRERSYGLGHVLLFAAGSVPAMFVAGFLYTPQSNYIVTQFWRWWVVHMWVEGVFEFFMVAVVAAFLLSTNLLTKRQAEKAVLLETLLVMGTGVIGVAHHFWWIALPEYWIPISTVWSTLELTPLLLILYEAFNQYKATAVTERRFPYRLPLMFIIAGSVWDFIGAGILGTIINFPAIGYYEHGTWLTVAHGHAAFLGAFGMFALGIGAFVLRVTTRGPAWSGVARWLRWSFWSINVGLAAMLAFSLVPVGFLQLSTVVTEGYTVARSASFYARPLVEVLLWARLPGDVLIIVGALTYTGAAVRSLLAARAPTDEASSPGDHAVAARVLSDD